MSTGSPHVVQVNLAGEARASRATGTRSQKEKELWLRSERGYRNLEGEAIPASMASIESQVGSQQEKRGSREACGISKLGAAANTGSSNMDGSNLGAEGK